MRNFILVLPFILLSGFGFGQAISEQGVIAQDDDQHSCVQRRLPECLKKCDSSNNPDIHCHGLCQLNITNECRYAGE